MTSFNQAVIAVIKECDAFGGNASIADTLANIKKLCVTLPGQHMNIHDHMSLLEKSGNWHNTVDALNDLKIDLAH